MPLIETLSTWSVFLTAVLAVLIIAVFATIRENRATLLLLATLIAFGCLFQIVVFLRASGRLSEQSSWYEALYPFHLGSIPILYLYVCSFTERDFKLSEISRWNILPFILGWVWTLIPVGKELSMERYARACFTMAITLPYLWTAQGQVNALKCQAKESRSSLLILRLPWLRFLLGLWYLSTFLSVVDIFFGFPIPLCFFVSVTVALELLGLTFYGLRYSQLFRQELRPLASATLNKEGLERRTNDLVNFLHREEFYLKPQIRLSDLAAALGVKTYMLSEVINRGLGTNFHDLINGLRIDRSKRMLLDPAYAHLNILGIATECGFNSKSSFNESFLRITGMTPSKFRDLQSKKLTK